MGCAFLAVMVFRRSGGWAERRGYIRGIWIALLSGTIVAVLFFSSFFTHWEGVWDSLLAYPTYFGRAAEESRHGHPWHYFLRLLTYGQGERGMAGNEAGIVFFGAVGIVSAFREWRTATGSGKDLMAFLGLYTCLMLLILSAIPYKTPWLVIGVLQPLIVMAGCGVAAFVGWLPRRLRVPGVITILLFAGHLAWQSYMVNFRLYDDPANPYVYSHPTDDVKQIAGVLESIRRSSPDGLIVQVVCPGDDYWPLPWYLRALPGVGWWNSVAKDFVATPVILASPDVEPDLMERLYDAPPPGERPLYIPLFDRPMFLRPGKEIRGYLRLDLHERLLKERSG
jgi:predicted membrane-bound mannosyltransferase